MSSVTPGARPRRERRGLHPAPGPGEPCGEHVLAGPDDDAELQDVLRALRRTEDLHRLFGLAVHEAVQYVLDGPRTWRFDLLPDEVDSDERASVGTKLQYRLIEHLGLTKLPPLDVVVAGHPVDIKGTVRLNWSIPEEAFCRLCICVQIDPGRSEHRAWLIRTHRVWLYGGVGNKDKKRGIQNDALNRFAAPLYDWSPYPQSPLKRLTASQRDGVFNLRDGQETRLLRLFRALPNTVMPRDTILTVCAQRADPMRRARAIKQKAAAEGIEVLVGTWVDDRVRAEELGFDLTGEAWVAVVEDEAAVVEDEAAATMAHLTPAAYPT